MMAILACRRAIHTHTPVAVDEPKAWPISCHIYKFFAFIPFSVFHLYFSANFIKSSHTRQPIIWRHISWLCFLHTSTLCTVHAFSLCIYCCCVPAVEQRFSFLYYCLLPNWRQLVSLRQCQIAERSFACYSVWRSCQLPDCCANCTMIKPYIRVPMVYSELRFFLVDHKTRSEIEKHEKCDGQNYGVCRSINTNTTMILGNLLCVFPNTFCTKLYQTHKIHMNGKRYMTEWIHKKKIQWQQYTKRIKTELLIIANFICDIRTILAATNGHSRVYFQSIIFEKARRVIVLHSLFFILGKLLFFILSWIFTDESVICLWILCFFFGAQWIHSICFWLLIYF